MNSARIRNSIFTFCISLVLSTICRGQSAQNYQTIKLDDSYNNIQKKGSPAAKKMQVTNPKGFILDCTGYDFTLIRSLNNGKDPDFIFIIAKGGKYKIPINLQGPILIDAGTMVSTEGFGKNFTGFEKEDKPILAIGTLKPGDDTHMLAYWVTLIELM
jgi:hypothetical protein